MAEVQRDAVQAGEMTRRFIEFVMMHARQAEFFLGRHPRPESGQAAVHLEPAKLFIDQLEMIRGKTQGNLTSEESRILDGVIGDLQSAFVEAAAAAGGVVGGEQGDVRRNL